jgi:ankyrin repeat protein
LAAIIHKRKRAVVKLLNSGADLTRANQYYGTAVHAAAGIGDAELLQLLIDHGADVNACNAQQQTPLATLTASRATLDRLVEAQAMMKSMGRKMPEILSQLSNVALPKEGWDRCEALLRASGGLDCD